MASCAIRSSPRKRIAKVTFVASPIEEQLDADLRAQIMQSVKSERMLWVLRRRPTEYVLVSVLLVSCLSPILSQKILSYLHRDKVVSPQYLALLRLKWFCGSERAQRDLFIEIIRPNDSCVAILPEWYPTFPAEWASNSPLHLGGRPIVSFFNNFIDFSIALKRPTILC